MIAVVLLGLVVVAVVALVRGRSRGSGARPTPDLPAQLVAGAVGRLPAARRPWGNAMAAELAQVPADHRWRFALGAARVLLAEMLSARRTVWVAGTGLAVAAVATVVAHAALPGLQVFLAVTGVLLTVYVALRSHRHAAGGAHRLVGGAAVLLGLLAVVTIVAYAAVAYPAATQDPTHLFSIVLALVVTGYVALALAPSRPGPGVATALWWGLGAGLACGLAWLVPVIVRRPWWETVLPGVPGLAAAVAVLAAAVLAAARTRSVTTGVHVGLWAGLTGALLLFIVGSLATLTAPPSTLTNPQDIAAFQRSGAPDVASYVIGDDLGGLIVMLILFPLTALVLGTAGGAIAAALTTRRHNAA